MLSYQERKGKKIKKEKTYLRIIFLSFLNSKQKPETNSKQKDTAIFDNNLRKNPIKF